MTTTLETPSRPKYKPYPEYKDSGAGWLGEIPHHWDTAKIIRYANLRTGGTPNRDNPEYWEDGDINWLASGEVNKRIITTVDTKITQAGMRNSNASLLPTDSVMIALNGQGRTKGMSAILKIADPNIKQSALANSKENFKFVFDKALEDFFLDRLDQNNDLFGRFMDDSDFKGLVSRHLLNEVYSRIHSQNPGGPSAPSGS